MTIHRQNNIVNKNVKMFKLKYHVIMISNSLFILALLLSINISAQQQVGGSLYDRYKNHAEEYIIEQQSQLNPPTPTPNGLAESPSVTMTKKILNDPPHQGSGNTAQNVANQQKQQASKTMGGATPNYTPGMTKEEMIAENDRFIKQQMANQKGYSQPTTENNFAQQSPQEMQYQQLINDLNQEYQLSNYLDKLEYYNSKKYLTDLTHFKSVKNMLKDMLSGKQKLSVKDAYFAVESAYGNLHLTYEEYNNTINTNVKFIKLWLTQQGYDLNNPEALHYGLQQFMNDTLKLKQTKIDDPLSGNFVTTHVPYYYDYIDYQAKEDTRNYFVTKTLATGTGQCHTLPVAYMVMAEALGIDVYLSYNPQHSFVQFKNNNGVMVNYETTIGQFITDQYYLETLPVMANAKRNKLYLESLNKEQVVATTLMDLAANFVDKHWVGNREFIEDCLNTANQFFPDKEYMNTRSHYLHRKLYANELNNIVQIKGLKGLDEIPNDPEALKIYNEYQEYMDRVNKSGFQDFPEEEYIRMMEYHDKKGMLQKAKKIDTKSKKSLYLTY